MKKNLFFFLFVPMISCAMDEKASEGQPVPGAPVVTRKNTPAVTRKGLTLRKSLVERIKGQEPTEDRGTEQIPSDGEFDLNGITTVEKIAAVHRKLSSSQLQMAKLPGEPRYNSKK